MINSTRRSVLSCLYYFVLVLVSPFRIAINSLGEERVNLSSFRTFVRFALVLFCLFPLPLGVLEGLRLVIVAVPGLFSYLFLQFVRRISSLLYIGYQSSTKGHFKACFIANTGSCTTTELSKLSIS